MRTTAPSAVSEIDAIHTQSVRSVPYATGRRREETESISLLQDRWCCHRRSKRGI